MHQIRTWVAPAGCLVLIAIGAYPAAGQTVRGRVIDSANGQPVVMAGVWLLDREREQVFLAMADSAGRYLLAVPDSGEYFIVAERFGYFETESPLLAISNSRDYDLDLELRPEPIRVGGVDVVVRNDQAIDWLRREMGVNPVSIFGFRLIQGERLQQAKLRGKLDPTNTLRFLYIPVSHGACVSINSLPRAQRQAGWTGRAPSLFEPVPGGTRSRDDDASSSGGGCGSLWVDDRRVPNEHLDGIDMSSIAVVVTFDGSVRMYTYGYDWSFRRR